MYKTGFNYLFIYYNDHEFFFKNYRTYSVEHVQNLVFYFDVG